MKIKTYKKYNLLGVLFSTTIISYITATWVCVIAAQNSSVPVPLILNHSARFRSHVIFRTTTSSMALAPAFARMSYNSKYCSQRIMCINYCRVQSSGVKFFLTNLLTIKLILLIC